jgi:hypothetical protein
MWRYVVWLQVTDVSASVHRVGLYSSDSETSLTTASHPRSSTKGEQKIVNYNQTLTILMQYKLTYNRRQSWAVNDGSFTFPFFFIPLHSVHCVWRQQRNFLRYSAGRGSRVLVRCITVTMAFLITAFTDSAGNYLPRLADTRHIHIVPFYVELSM